MRIKLADEYGHVTRPDSKMIDGKKIIASIKEEHNLIEGNLYLGEICFADDKSCRSEGHCAIGKLLFDAGMSNEQLAKAPSSGFKWNSREAKLLWEHYGLRPWHAEQIIRTNDYVMYGRLTPKQEIRLRRKQVIDTVKELVSKQKADPVGDFQTVLDESDLEVVHEVVHFYEV